MKRLSVLMAVWAAAILMLCAFAAAEDLHERTHWESDEEAHWLQCDECGEVIGERIEHFTFCSKPGVCYECGAPFTEDVVNHEGPVHYEADESSHWKVCDGCGETMEGPAGHSIDCRTPDEKKCYYCGEEYWGSNRAHSMWKTNRTDPEFHWDECTNCRARVSTPERHRVNCALTTGCEACGAPIENIQNPELVHPYAGYRYDILSHWKQCACGEAQSEKEPHTTSPDIAGWCPVCDFSYDAETSDEYENGRNVNNRFGKLAWFADGELVDFTGMSSFEGAMFYFEHGVVRDDLMGPVQIDNVWYAFDAGRVMTQQMLVPYDGGVFAFHNGVLDTSQNGLVTFNGEQFVFAGGQFQADVFGAWHDPISGEWVYIWNGQYYEITDLVSYDGEIFYFVDGRLALDYTGPVQDFQGVTHNVVNGQVR